MVSMSVPKVSSRGRVVCHQPHRGDVRHHCQKCVLEAHSMFLYRPPPLPPFYRIFLLEFSDLVAHPHYFLQIIPRFSIASLIDKFSMYLFEESVMVTVQTNRGYSFKVEV